MPEQPVQVSGKFGQSLSFAIAIRTEQVIFFKGPLACTQFREAWVKKHSYAISRECNGTAEGWTLLNQQPQAPIFVQRWANPGLCFVYFRTENYFQ